jgi:hypothetical protein
MQGADEAPLTPWIDETLWRLKNSRHHARASVRAAVIDLYGPLLAKALFPAFEAARGRPTVPLLRYLQDTERWTPGALRDLQVGLLRRVLRHAYRHTEFYRDVLDQRSRRHLLDRRPGAAAVARPRDAARQHRVAHRARAAAGGDHQDHER